MLYNPIRKSVNSVFHFRKSYSAESLKEQLMNDIPSNIVFNYISKTKVKVIPRTENPKLIVLLYLTTLNTCKSNCKKKTIKNRQLFFHHRQLKNWIKRFHCLKLMGPKKIAQSLDLQLWLQGDVLQADSLNNFISEKSNSREVLLS